MVCYKNDKNNIIKDLKIQLSFKFNASLPEVHLPCIVSTICTVMAPN